jgi:hypothetical protein
MSLLLKPLTPSDVPWIGQRLQAAQVHPALSAMLTIEYGADLVAAGPSWTAFGPDGPVAAAGLAPQWDDHAKAWAMLADDAAQHLVAITRAIRRFLDGRPERRIDTAVRTDFAAGHRWARMLGFEREGTMRCWMGGQDHDLYARVR